MDALPEDKGFFRQNYMQTLEISLLHVRYTRHNSPIFVYHVILSFMPIFQLKHVVLFGFVLFAAFFSYGQGCSDAGFCTLNGFKPNGEDSLDTVNKNYVSVGFSKGEADYHIGILSAYIEYHRQLSEKIGVDAKITGLNHSDANLSTTGLSDLYINAHYGFIKNATVLGSIKIPLQDGNKLSNEGLALPMDYQASLGTFDLIIGLKYEIKKLSITAGLQQPLIQNNNQYLSEKYSVTSPYKGFQSTNKYKRSGDILLRLSYPIRITKKFTVSPSALLIYHLTEDRFTDINNIEQSISGSKGLTFNGTLYFDYALNKRNSVNLNMGKPFITRKTRPDGLTREYIITLEYKFKF